jgi:hypothetical protein
VRFGQLISNLSYLAIGPTNEAIWDMEDEQLIDATGKHIANLSATAIKRCVTALFRGSVPRRP